MAGEPELWKEPCVPSNPMPMEADRPRIPTPTRYSSLQIALHWSVAVLIVAQWATSDAYSRTRNSFFPARPADLLEFQIHIISGVAIGVFMLVRLVSIFRHGRRRATGPYWIRLAAAILHFSLHALLLAQVATGLLAAYVWNGAGTFHAILWKALIVTIGLHMLAAVVHSCRGDHVIRRMMPRL